MGCTFIKTVLRTDLDCGVFAPNRSGQNALISWQKLSVWIFIANLNICAHGLITKALSSHNLEE